MPCGLALSAVLSLVACDPGPGDPASTGSKSHAATGTGSTGTTLGRDSTGSGSTSGSALVDGCPSGLRPCTPANVCNYGCSQAGGGGACVDQLTANNAQTGVVCDAGAVCEGTICLSGSGPQVPNLQGGVLVQPNLVIMTYDTDPNQAAIEQWGVWIADGGYLSTTVGQYGVGNGTVQFVRLKDAAQLSGLPGCNSHVSTDPLHLGCDHAGLRLL